MERIVHDLKAKARILQALVQKGERDALLRVRKLPELAETNDTSLPAAIQRRHCLSVIARELGFDGWAHALSVLTGQRSDDFGCLLSPPGAAAHWNIWSASYDEARAIRAEHGGYLLAYKRHYFIVDRYYLETLGLDPEDEDWDRMDRDWVHPREPAARARLYAKLIARRYEAAQ
jgi:hypothetical protein